MIKDKDEKRVYREVKSEVKFKVISTKDGKKGEEAIITVPPEVVKNFSKEQRDSLTAMVETNSEKEQEKQEEKGEKNFKRTGFVILPIVLVVSLLSHSCGNDVKIITDTQQIAGIHYENEYIEEYLGAVTNYAGQEQMTRAALEGKNAFDKENSAYSADQQFEAETKSSEGIEESKDIREEIQENLQILTNEKSTQQQIYNAAKKIKELNEKINLEYKYNQDLARQQVNKFEEASEAFKDSKTENEMAVINEILKDYKSQLGLTENNLSVMNTIIELCENGYEITLEGVKELDGDWQISGEAVREVVEEQEQSGIKNAWKNFKNFITGKDQNREGQR